MKLSNSALQNLQSRCLAAIFYKRELALADKYQASLEAEAGSITSQETQIHTILALVERVLLIRSGNTPKVIPVKVQSQPIVVSRLPLAAPVEPVISPEVVEVTDELSEAESIVSPEGIESVNDDPPPDIKKRSNQPRRSNRRN